MVGIGVKKKLLHRIIDAFIIVIQVTYGMSMLKVWLLDPLTPLWDISVTVVMFVAYVIRVKHKFILIKNKGYFLPKLILLIYLIDVFQAFIIGSVSFAFSRGLFMLNIFLFMDYLISMDKEQKLDVKTFSSQITWPYEVYSYYNVITVLLCAILILSGIISPTDNTIEENTLIMGNIQNGESYYFPGHLSLAMSSFRLLSFLGIPLLTGLSHEPHVLWWLVGPCFYLLLDRFKDKRGVYILFILAFLILAILSTSMTALMVFGGTLLLDMFYNTFMGKQKSGTLVVFIIAFAVFAYFLSKNEFLRDAVSIFAEEKINDDGSLGYSVSGLSYMFKPRSLIGWGNVTMLGWGRELNNADIGFITFFLDVFLLIALYYNAFKLFLSKDYHIHYIGLACLYFLLHSLKLGTQVFTFPYFAYIIVLIEISRRYAKPFVKIKNDRK